MMTPRFAFWVIPFLFAACSSAPEDGDAGTPDSGFSANDSGARLDAGSDASVQDGAADGGFSDVGFNADATPGDATRSDAAAAVRLSDDVLVRPLRFSTDGQWLAYWERYSEAASQTNTNGRLHQYQVNTGTDFQIGSNISPLGLRFSDDWSRVLYFKSLTNTLNGMAFAYDRVAGTSFTLGNATFAGPLLAKDGTSAVVAENYVLANGTGDVLRFDWPAGTSTPLGQGDLIQDHDLPRWFLYVDGTGSMHLARPGSDQTVGVDVEPRSVVVSADKSTIVFVRAVGAQGGALERFDAQGTVEPVSANVRPNLVRVSSDGTRIIYGSGANADTITSLSLSVVGSAVVPIATDVVAASVAIGASLQAAAYCISTGPGVGDLYRWTEAGGAQRVASGVSTEVRSWIAEDGSAVVYFTGFESAARRGQLHRYTNGQSTVLGENVSSAGLSFTPNLERLAFVQNATADRGALMIFTGAAPIMIAAEVAAQTTSGGEVGYYTSPALDRVVAHVPGASMSIGSLVGWREGSSPGTIAGGVPSGSWRISPDGRTLAFLADFVDETSGADHGTLQVSSEQNPTPTTVHPSVGRSLSLSNSHLAFVVVGGTLEDGLYLTALP
jgi:hypothetical protein